MTRIRIEPPKQSIFSTNVKVRVTDLNYGNHLGNDALLGLLHEARVCFYTHLGFPDERNIYGAGVIMADAAIQYRSEAFLGDQLTIDIGIGEISRMGYDLIYAVVHQSGRLIATAKTGMVCFDYSTRKPVGVPAEFLLRIQV